MLNNVFVIASANDSESGFEPYGLNTGTASARLAKSRKFFLFVFEIEVCLRRNLKIGIRRSNYMSCDVVALHSTNSKCIVLNRDVKSSI